jgi:adenylate cyclase class 2
MESPPLEIEVKFWVSEPEMLHGKILSLGAKSLGQTEEHNTIWDDKSGSIRKKNALLRLREDGRATLTVKAETSNKADCQCKVMAEWETALDNPAAMRQILDFLGYFPVRCYEKKRHTFEMGSVLLMLDTMPFGIFLEIEGREEAIKEAAAALGLDWQERIVLNYFELFEIIQQKENIAFNDITFENFSGLSPDMAACLPDFCAKP